MREITVKGKLRDTIAFIRHLNARERIFAKAAAAAGGTPAFPAPMNRLSARLHPRGLTLTVLEARPENAAAVTYRLGSSDSLPLFRAGQYISIQADMRGSVCSRPYSLSSLPAEALEGPFYEITVKRTDPGFVSPFIMDSWKPGTIVKASGPEGLFYYEPLRDKPLILCLAGGSGIAPLRSLIPDTLERYPYVSCALLYGVRESGDLLWKEFFRSLESAYPGRFVFTPVCSGDDPKWKGERGFLDAPSIRETIQAVREKAAAGGPPRGDSGVTRETGPRLEGLDDITIFICGPPAMHRFLEGELARFSLPPGRVRRENSGAPEAPGIERSADVVYSIAVTDPFGMERVIGAAGSETVLTALERAGMNPPSRCRSGHCGFCRVRLVSGRVVSERRAEEFLRAADRRFGYFHPCSAYPGSDLSIRIPENPV